MINGNCGSSHNIGMWNCKKGLIDGENQSTYKMVEVKKFIEDHNLHLLCLVEAGLHGPASRIRRKNPITTQGIMNNLQIEGYRIILPKTWQYHNQARIILFAKDDLKVTEKVTPREFSDLPTITCKIGIGREKKSTVKIFCREWKSEMSGLKDIRAQSERLTRQIECWNISRIQIQTNLNALMWDEDNYELKEMANQVREYLADTLSFQIIKEKPRKCHLCR